MTCDRRGLPLLGVIVFTLTLVGAVAFAAGLAYGRQGRDDEEQGALRVIRAVSTEQPRADEGATAAEVAAGARQFWAGVRKDPVQRKSIQQ